MKRLSYFVLLACVGLLMSACTESSIDSAMQNEEKSGSIQQGQQKQQQKKQEDITDGSIKVKPRWRSVMNIRGSGDQKSRLFKIDSPKWRIQWHTEAPSSGESKEFFIQLHAPETGETLFIATSPEDDMAELDTPGEFKLEVRAEQPYNISVKEFK
jgi:hypothetical protein